MDIAVTSHDTSELNTAVDIPIREVAGPTTHADFLAFAFRCRLSTVSADHQRRLD